MVKVELWVPGLKSNQMVEIAHGEVVEGVEVKDIDSMALIPTPRRRRFTRRTRLYPRLSMMKSRLR